MENQGSHQHGPYGWSWPAGPHGPHPPYGSPWGYQGQWGNPAGSGTPESPAPEGGTEACQESDAPQNADAYGGQAPRSAFDPRPNAPGHGSWMPPSAGPYAASPYWMWGGPIWPYPAQGWGYGSLPPPSSFFAYQAAYPWHGAAAPYGWGCYPGGHYGYAPAPAGYGYAGGYPYGPPPPWLPWGLGERAPQPTFGGHPWGFENPQTHDFWTRWHHWNRARSRLFGGPAEYGCAWDHGGSESYPYVRWGHPYGSPYGPGFNAPWSWFGGGGRAWGEVPPLMRGGFPAAA